MMLSLFGDAVVAALLIATISYAAVLNARLGVLRGDRAKLDELVRSLTEAAQRADAGIAALKATTEDVGRRLERKIEEGQRLRDDLGYMLERGGSIADRLEGSIRARRDEVKPEAAPERKRDPRSELPPRLTEPGRPARTEPRLVAEEPAAPRTLASSRAERDLLRALSGR